jgi:protein-disulfide isomerase
VRQGDLQSPSANVQFSQTEVAPCARECSIAGIAMRFILPRFFNLLGLGTALALLTLCPLEAQQKPDVVDSVLGDTAAPVGGNPHGDVTIVAFLDYNCPYCRHVTPSFDHFVTQDGHVKVIYKEWPILDPSSVIAAKVALAANYQGKYQVAHDALMAIKLHPLTLPAIKAAVQGAGIDIGQLDKDLAAHNDDIGRMLQKNISEADALHFNGTPVFLVGPYLLAGAPEEAEFRQAVARVRGGQ